MEEKEFSAYINIENPPNDFKLVGYALMIIRYNNTDTTKFTWENVQDMLKDPRKFINELDEFDPNSTSHKQMEVLYKLLPKGWFNSEIEDWESKIATLMFEWVKGSVDTIFHLTKIVSL